MSWNYRIVNDGRKYWVAEVFYDRNGKYLSHTGPHYNPTSYWETEDEVRGTVEKITAALNKPILTVGPDNAGE